MACGQVHALRAQMLATHLVLPSWCRRRDSMQTLQQAKQRERASGNQYSTYFSGSSFAHETIVNVLSIITEVNIFNVV
jgi:hypothetical protein